MGGWLLVNPRSGNGSGVDELCAAAAARGVETRVLRPGEDATTVAGGARADERGLPFVCVPMGTRNHFARDLGLDRADPIAALDAFEGAERRKTLRTRVLLIANNAYSLSGARDHLDEGRLHLYTPRGEIRIASRVVVSARSRNLRAAVDGERAVFETPLELAIEPGALLVLVPPA